MSEIGGTGKIVERWLQDQKKKQEGKLKINEEKRGFLNKYSAYVWAKGHTMNSELIWRKYRALCLFAEFYSRGFMLGARICEQRVAILDNAILSGYNAVPSVLVDDDDGTYAVLMREAGMSGYGGLKDFVARPEEIGETG